jgi:hypothetical protein
MVEHMATEAQLMLGFAADFRRAISGIFDKFPCRSSSVRN